MITIEMLNNNSATAALTEAQKAAIAELSKNDEATVIGTKIGALHGQYDTDIFNITNTPKNNGEKSYDYLKRILSDYKNKADATSAIQTKLDAANKEVSELKTKIEKGSQDAVLKQQLRDAQNQVIQLQSQLTKKQEELTTKEAEYKSEIKSAQVDFAFTNAVSGIKFKDGVSESVQKILINAAKNEILAKGTPDFIEGSDGNKKFVLRDENNNTINNPKNNLNPYTLKELIMETSLKDVIDTGKQQPGGGTKPIMTNNGAAGTLDLSGIATQVAADSAIEKYLLASGVTRDNPEFGVKLLEIRNENNVSELPIR